MCNTSLTNQHSMKKFQRKTVNNKATFSITKGYIYLFSLQFSCEKNDREISLPSNSEICINTKHWSVTTRAEQKKCSDQRFTEHNKTAAHFGRLYLYSKIVYKAVLLYSTTLSFALLKVVRELLRMSDSYSKLLLLR